MEPENKHCAQLLLDILGYEIQRDNVTPEMLAVLEHHLGHCPDCRIGLRNYWDLIRCVAETRVGARALH